LSKAHKNNDENRQAASETGDERSSAASANTNTRHLVDLPLVDGALTIIENKVAELKTASVANVIGSISDLQSTLTAVRKQITAAAVEAVARAPDGKVEIPGEMVPGKGIFIGEFDLADARGKKLGIRTRWYDAAVELGKPMTFNATADAVANCDVNGRGGLRLNPARYEAELFRKLKTSKAMGKNVIAPLEVVQAIYELRNQGEYKRRSDGNLPGQLITTKSGNTTARWQWSCTPDLTDSVGVWVVYFADGHVGWGDRVNLLLSSRVCFAELGL
jgi:hypothetical protein